MKLRYDLIALDVDGTLLTDDHELREEVKEVVREAEAAGAQIVLCTGRGPNSAFPVLEKLELGGTLIGHNGAVTVTFEDERILHQYQVEPEEIIEFIRYCRSNNVHFDLNTAFEMMLEQMTNEVKVMYEQFEVAPLLHNFDDGIPSGLLKLSAYGSKELIDAVYNDWSKWPSGLQAVRSGDSFIDVLHSDATKGKALRQFGQSLGIERDRILAIGNYYNDLTMLEYAGLGVAMGNSPDAVKHAADVVAPSNNEGGVASALRQYAWS